jgi:hypothetical protein
MLHTYRSTPYVFKLYPAEEQIAIQETEPMNRALSGMLILFKACFSPIEASVDESQ